jgi:hypothetical protein
MRPLSFVIFFMFFPFLLSGYKVGYSIPFNEIPAQHEVLTSRSMYHLCSSRGVGDLKASPVYNAFFHREIFSCEEIKMDFDPGKFVQNINESPVAGIILGSRWPDLMEITGVDADMQDLTVVKYSNEVQFDSYRIHPLFHAQLSKYHNVFGGDMELAVRVMRDYVKALFYEILYLSLSYNNSDFNENWVTSFSSFLHDTNANGPQYWFEIPWHTIMLGVYQHMTADGFSHNSIRMLDVKNNKILHNSIYYGKFKNDSGDICTAGNSEFTDSIHPELGQSLSNLGDLRDSFYCSKKELNLSDIPEKQLMEGELRSNYYTDSVDRRFMSGYLSTTLSVYSFYEIVELFFESADILETPFLIDILIDSYIKKWWDFDFNAIDGFTPVSTQGISEINPDYLKLPWHQYHFVDIWKQSLHPDRTVDNFGAFILPWTDRSSMDDKLKDEKIFGRRFVLLPDSFEEYDPDSKIFTIKKDHFYFFKSWHRISDSYYSLKPEAELHFSVTDDELTVKELEIDPDFEEPFNIDGLNRTYAFIYVPPGWRMCLFYPGDPGGKKVSSRTDWYDSRKPYYRCFYGSSEGAIAHANFHIRTGARIKILPIDADLDGIPFLKGLKDNIYQDNCPLDYNPDQSIVPCLEDDNEEDVRDTDDNEFSENEEFEEEENDEAIEVIDDNSYSNESEDNAFLEDSAISKRSRGCLILFF